MSGKHQRFLTVSNGTLAHNHYGFAATVYARQRSSNILEAVFANETHCNTTVQPSEVMVPGVKAFWKLILHSKSFIWALLII